MDLSAGSLFASLGVSTVGFGIFLYGKKQVRIPPLVVGLLMMIYPYFVGSPAWMLVAGGGLVGGLWLATRAGL